MWHGVDISKMPAWVVQELKIGAMTLNQALEYCGRPTIRDLGVNCVSTEEVRTMADRPYRKKEELYAIAQDMLDRLKQEKLPAWQVKEVFKFASELVDWEVVQ